MGLPTTLLGLGLQLRADADAARRQHIATLASRLMKYLLIAACFLAIIIFAEASNLVELALGGSYLPAATGAKALALGLPAVSILGLALAFSVAETKPFTAIRLNAVALITFIGGSLLLTPVLGSVGAAIAGTFAMVAAAGLACIEFPLVPLLRRAHAGRILSITALSLACSALPVWNLIPVGLIGIALFPLLLIVMGVVSREEIARVVATMAAR